MMIAFADDDDHYLDDQNEDTDNDDDDGDDIEPDSTNSGAHRTTFPATQAVVARLVFN